jgi:inorganic pyrophosphatase/exopolyphosphatase
MFYLDVDNTYNKNLGSSQNDRFLNALNENYFLIDEFDFKSFIHFISQHASQVAYFNEKNILDGDWKSFFYNDPTFSVLRLAFYIDNSSGNTQKPINIYERKNKKILVKEIQFTLNQIISHFKKIEENLNNRGKPCLFYY